LSAGHSRVRAAAGGGGGGAPGRVGVAAVRAPGGVLDAHPLGGHGADDAPAGLGGLPPLRGGAVRAAAPAVPGGGGGGGVARADARLPGGEGAPARRGGPHGAPRQAAQGTPPGTHRVSFSYLTISHSFQIS